MPGRKRKTEIITFKADESLLDAMKGVPNRSEFIRSAVLAALEGACPVCGGSGVLSASQMRHWEAFAADHAMETCGRCQEVRIVCSRDRRRKGRRAEKKSC